MIPFWKNDKYQSSKTFPKEDIIQELHRFMKPFDINSLPSFSSLKWVFRDMNRESITEKIRQKAGKRRQRYWQHNRFNEELIAEIDTKENTQELAYWAGVFLEYYKSMKSETKND